MPSNIIVVGHKNPDNDSISSAVACAYLKNELEKRAAQGGAPENLYVAARLGGLPPESAWVLEDNGFTVPGLINHVHLRVSDAMTTNPVCVAHGATLLEAAHLLRKFNIRALVATNDDGTYCGLITARTIAERYIAATDHLVEDSADSSAVGSSLIASLEQCVSETLDSDALILKPESLLAEATEDLMASSLRVAVVLDEDEMPVGILTRSDVIGVAKRKVVLVDHNEISQAVDGIEDAEVVEVIDHHRIADISTANPIQFLNYPVGSTATIIATEFRRYEVEMPVSIAKVLLSAILTDTVIMKSPTTTDIDRTEIARLAEYAGVDPIEFGLSLFKRRGGEAEMPIHKLVGADAKEFQVGDSMVLIAQYETVNLEGVLDREQEIREHMRGLLEKNGYDFVLFLATDIMAEGSQFICEGNRRLVNRVFEIECTGEGGTWMPGVLSRKKQVAAKILGA